MKNIFLFLFLIFSLFNSFVSVFASPSAGEREDMVRQYYREHLNRDCDSSGLRYWSEQIAQRGSDAVKEEIKTSEEGFVHGCYQRHLNRFADDDGLKNWIKYMKQYGRDRCRNAIGNSKEASDLRTNCVTEWYQEFLHREPGEEGLRFWCEHIFDHGYDYAKSRLQDSDEAFVHMCYTQHLNRQAEPKGLQNWMSKLKGNSREAVYRMIQESEEAARVQRESTIANTITNVSDLQTMLEQKLHSQVNILNNAKTQKEFISIWKEISLLFEEDYNFVFNYIYNLFLIETNRHIKIAFAFILNDKRPNHEEIKAYLLGEGFTEQKLEKLNTAQGSYVTMGLSSEIAPIPYFNLQNMYYQQQIYYRFTHKIVK